MTAVQVLSLRATAGSPMAVQVLSLVAKSAQAPLAVQVLSLTAQASKSLAVQVLSLKATATVGSALAARAGADRVGVLGFATVLLDGSSSTGAVATTSPGGVPLDPYRWEQIPNGAPTVELIDGEGPVRSYIAPCSENPITIQWRLTVSNASTSAVDTVTHTIQPWLNWMNGSGIWYPVQRFMVRKNQDPVVDPPTEPPLTRNAPLEFGTLQTMKEHAPAEIAGGLTYFMAELEWRYWQPTADSTGKGIRNTSTANYVPNMISTITTILNAGGKVSLGLGLHHPPAWVSSLNGESVLYTNELGELSTATVLGGGFDNIDFTLSAKARQLAEAYIADVKLAFGDALWNRITTIRDAVNGTGEQMYPQKSGTSKYNYWGFSSRAQSGAGLAAGMTAAPNAGVPTAGQVGPWLQWYQDARAKTSMWMIDFLCRSKVSGGLAFPGNVAVITPGRGLTATAWAAQLARQSLQTNHLVGVGAVWQELYDDLNNGPWAARTLMHCSSVADGSGSNTPPSDADDALTLTSSSADNFGSARWFRFMFRKFTNLGGLSGENPGSGSSGYGPAMLTAAFNILKAGGWNLFQFAHDEDLWSDDGTAALVPIQTYYDSVTAYRNGTALPEEPQLPPGYDPDDVEAIAAALPAGWNPIYKEGFDTPLAVGEITYDSQGKLTGSAATKYGNSFSTYGNVPSTHNDRVYEITAGEPGYVPGQTNFHDPVKARWRADKTVSVSDGYLQIKQWSDNTTYPGVLTNFGAAVVPILGNKTPSQYMIDPFLLVEFSIQSYEVMRDGVDLAAAGDVTSGLPLGMIRVPLLIASDWWTDGSEWDFPDGEHNRPTAGTMILAQPTLNNPKIHPAGSKPYDKQVWRYVWEPDSAKVYLNGVLVYSLTGSGVTPDPMAFVMQLEANWRQAAITSSAKSRIGYILIAKRTVPYTYAADTFTRSNTTSTIGVSTGPGTPTWTNLSGNWGISNNAAYVFSGPAHAVLQTGKRGHAVETTILGLPSSTTSWAGISVRVVDATNFHWADLNSSGQLRVFKMIEGVATQLGTTQSPAFVVGDKIKVKMQSTWIKVYKNGVQIYEVQTREERDTYAETVIAQRKARNGTMIGLRASSSAGMATVRFGALTVTSE